LSLHVKEMMMGCAGFWVKLIAKTEDDVVDNVG